MEIKNIPFTLKEIEQQIKAIDNLCPETTSIDEYQDKLDKLLTNIFAQSYGIRSSHGEGFIWRARNEFVSNLDGLKYAPKDCIKGLGRMNEAKESIFYASIGQNANIGSLDEIRVEDGSLVTQITYGVKKDFNLVIGIGHMNLLGGAPHRQALAELGLSEVEFEKQAALSDWLQDAFLAVVPEEDEEKNGYKKTIAISRVFKKLFSEQQGILFPSVSSQGSCTNIALEPSLMDEMLEPISARVVIATKAVNRKGYNFQYLKKSKSINLETGLIDWEECSVFNQEAKDLYDRADKSKMIAFDGKVYFPHPDDPSKLCVHH
ncbi:hypothetical protein [Vibrio jasicida]|uniref:hypothetical protein n=1 Tax=Vibrio jasicida TaxID=766224 RepID=UPI000CE3CD7A|nr:hypothetical protein [Vibrio jasicida]